MRSVALGNRMEEGCVRRTATRRIVAPISRGAVAALVLFFVAESCCARAQNAGGQSNSNTSYNGSTLFVPSLDVNSATSFASVDAARRNRPPEPSKTREDLYYPDGFLTLSSPTPNPKESDSLGKEDSDKSETRGEGEKIRPLDPSVETTPLVLNPYPGVKEPEKRKRDKFSFFAFSIALAGLGVFVYLERRYRDQLRDDIARNSRLCSPNATSADFESVLASNVDLTDPRAPSYANPRYDADVLMFNDPDPSGKNLTDPNFDDFHFEASASRLGRRGPSLSEENFDFVPEGTERSPADELPEDFVVSGCLAKFNGSQNPPEQTK